MTHCKRVGFITTAIISMFFIACGGGGSNGGNNNNRNDNAPSISISQSAVKAYVGEPKTINVTAKNTDFEVSVSPSGSGCAKSDNGVTCTPTAAGMYTVTVTATVDASKRVTAMVTVPELEIFGGNGQTLYADDDEAIIEFSSASSWTAAAADGSGGAPAWLSLNTESGLAGINDFTFQLDDGNPDDTDVTANAVNVSGQSGNNIIRVTLLPNDSMADRTATITITTPNGRIETTITQRYVTRDGNPYVVPQGVAISISPMTADTTVGVSRTYTVTRQNTADFTISAPAAAGCVKNGLNAVACTPTAAGTYTIRVTASADTAKYASATLTAAATVQELHTVTFNIDGSIQTRQARHGSSLGPDMPSNPEKSGYYFAGWNTSSSAANANFYSITAVTSNITVYAIWQPVIVGTFEVRFNIDGAIDVIEHLTSGSTLGANMPSSPTKIGYDFVGWNTNASATTGNFTSTTPVTANMTVYAIWLVKTYTVTFNTDGSTQTRQAQHDASLGSNMPSSPTKTGYDFVGWNTDSSATSGNFTATTPVTADMTVYAIWKIKTCTVTFNPDNGTTNIIRTVDCGTSFGASFPADPVKPEFKFEGWFYSTDFYNYHRYTTSTVIANDITLKARWITMQGDGSSGNPYIIMTASHLDNVRNNPTAHYRLGADISLYGWGGSEGWDPIGWRDGTNLSFWGVFDGNGYKITGLTVKNAGGGLFSSVTSSTITNLAIENVDISSEYWFVGGIAGSMYNSTISNSYSTGNISGGVAGGIAGSMSNSTITNSYSTGDISGKDIAGGIAGVVGDSSAIISSSTIINSYSTGNISGIDYNSAVGGILGGIAIDRNATITNCVAINNEITATSGIYGVGRIVGYIFTEQPISNNFALSTMTDPGIAKFDSSDTRRHGVDKTDVQLRMQSTYSGAINGDGLGGLGWRFGSDDDNPWKMPAAGGYPILYWQ